jgi:hypothetical protein
MDSETDCRRLFFIDNRVSFPRYPWKWKQSMLNNGQETKRKT